MCRSVRAKRLYQTNTEKHMVLHLKHVLRKNTFREEQVRKRCIQRLAIENARLGQSSRNIGPSWSVLGPSWDYLGRSWGPFEAFLKRSCNVFGLSWRRLGRSSEPKHDVAGKTVWKSRGNHCKSRGNHAEITRESADLSQGQVAKLSLYEDIGLDLLHLLAFCSVA